MKLLAVKRPDGDASTVAPVSIRWPATIGAEIGAMAGRRHQLSRMYCRNGREPFVPAHGLEDAAHAVGIVAGTGQEADADAVGFPSRCRA